jgi:hypothetical protein
MAYLMYTQTRYLMCIRFYEMLMQRTEMDFIGKVFKLKKKTWIKRLPNMEKGKGRIHICDNRVDLSNFFFFPFFDIYDKI